MLFVWRYRQCSWAYDKKSSQLANKWYEIQQYSDGDIEDDSDDEVIPLVLNAEEG